MSEPSANAFEIMKGLSDEIEQLRKLVEQMQMELSRMQRELEASHTKVKHLETENGRLGYELNELKQAPFKDKKRKSREQRRSRVGLG